MDLGKFLLGLFNSEVPSTEKCLSRITESIWDFKPHPTSMNMGYLALLVAEIPLWISTMIEVGEIDFATYKTAEPKNNADLMAHFQNNVAGARKALEGVSEDALAKTFYLKSSGKELFKAPVKDYIAPTINHWVHHRGQLTVYMRMKEIPVPSIYGPSADDRSFG